MKKFIALAIAVVMLAALAVPAFAEEEFNPVQSGSMNVTYGIDSEYTLVIPTETAINATAPVVLENKLGVEGTNIRDDESITLVVSTNGTLTDALGESQENAFTVAISDDAAEGATDISELTATITTESLDTVPNGVDYVKFTITAGTLPTWSGTFTGSVTFTATLA